MSRQIPLLDLRAVHSWPRRCQRGRHRLGMWFAGRFIEADWIVGDPPLHCRDCSYRRGLGDPLRRWRNRPQPIEPRPPTYGPFIEWLDGQLLDSKGEE